MINALREFLVWQGGYRPRLGRVCATLHNILGWNRCRAGRDSRVIAPYAYLHRVRVENDGHGNIVYIERGTRLSNTLIRFQGNGHRLRVGPDCVIKKGVFWFEDGGCAIDIGAGTTAEDVHVAVTEPGRRVAIGKDCMLAYDVEMRTGDSHAICSQGSTTAVSQGADVAVGDHVWLAPHVSILKGVSVGDGAIIGTRSVVTADVPACTMAAGAPARVRKVDVRWTRQRQGS